MKTLKDFTVAQKRILVRCDFNVPLDEQGNIIEEFKITETLPTIRYLIEHGAKIILMSHLGEPKDHEPVLQLTKVAEKLSELLAIPVATANDCIGSEVQKLVTDLQPGQVLLLENLKFNPGEKANDPAFAKALAALGDTYINDAFASCHRNYASVVEVTHYLPHGAGLLLEKEVANLNKILQHPERPMVALIGGTKVETKARLIETICKVADSVIVSGLIKKEIEERQLQFASPEKIIGPKDNLAALDINQASIQAFREKIMQAKTVFWNGPFGKFEDAEYKIGTLAIANTIIESGAFSVVGGGETVEFINKEHLLPKFSHVSTGGGAMLSFLSGEKLPGLEALEA